MSVLCAVTHRKEDAARKWCPFAWTRNKVCSETGFSSEENPPDPGPAQHNGPAAIDSRCLTIRCMAWIDETDYFYGITQGRCGLVTLARI